MKIIILDYGSGNVGSLSNILKILNYDFKVSNNKLDIENGSHFILPVVGAFKYVMEKINKNLPIKFLKDEIINKKKPLLGICVGMQVLADYGFENGKHEGLGLINGTVKKMKTKSILPHVGWINIEI